MEGFKTLDEGQAVEYAEKIGADHYAPNAVSAVNFVNEVFGK